MNKRNLLFLTVWTLSGFSSYQAFADDGNTTEIRTLTPEIEISKEGVLINVSFADMGVAVI